ncbi:MAG: hypothetical protein WA667_29855 [Candidatus Nitrosopolaris sp.]
MEQFRVGLSDTHGRDVGWTMSITKVNFDNGTQRKIVIGHDKMEHNCNGCYDKQ